uniref:Ubiquitin carboxyl-terminal hydrolase n=1 Tax=Gadus morhua TaxID=8049 RepID=A0A8C5FKP3_GADMO
MASHSNQYIFGEFSPDEINQFFVTPRCYVELPPFNDKVPCVSQSTAEDYQPIAFGVDEVMDTTPIGVKDPLFKVSSTLNPQAPEFILGCPSTQSSLQAAGPPADVMDCVHFDMLDGPDSMVSADMDGMSGGLGPRERRKKKKRPPGYYNYLEGSPGYGGAWWNNGRRPARARAAEWTCIGAPNHGVDNVVAQALSGRYTEPLPLPGVPRTPRGVSGRPPTLLGTRRPPTAGGGRGLRGGQRAGWTRRRGRHGGARGGAVRGVGARSAGFPRLCSPACVRAASRVVRPFGQPSQILNVVEVVAPSLWCQSKPEKAGEVKESPVHVSEDPLAPKLAELIDNVKLIHKPVSLQPRGLINKGNWCYINATLQALIACPPMYHLMKSIPLHNDSKRLCTSTPMIDNFVRLVNEFNNMPVPSKPKHQAAGDKLVKDIRPGVPFEPTYIYRLLTLIKSSLSEKGRQEDAEEYLGFTLNGLHEEMLALKRLISPHEDESPTRNGPAAQPEEDQAADKQEEESEEEWEQVGPRNKTSITRQADFVSTPITDIFGGTHEQNSKESATLQPFFTLQLDIQSEKIRTVQEALETLVARESVQGYTSKTKQEIEISRRVTLEELPPVLVLHLKRFVFEKTGGCQKLTKHIDYPVDLEISKDLLSTGVRSKVVKGLRMYRLFAVVYHHGNSATGGHYTTDVFHIGLNGWLRIDDQAVKVINQYHVVKQSAERSAYLLYYRRVDLL